MELSHPPVEGHDRCETTPDLMQEDLAIGMASHTSSCEATSTLLPITPVSSPMQTSVHQITSSFEISLGFVSSPRLRLSGSKRIASCPTGYTWFLIAAVTATTCHTFTVERQRAADKACGFFGRWRWCDNERVLRQWLRSSGEVPGRFGDLLSPKFRVFGVRVGWEVVSGVGGWLGGGFGGGSKEVGRPV
uniref:Uncharacterized protein n=1 Tax=Chenopodium quinoa TaxID=63459 RepID=A0A803LUT2_CHEQI